MKYEWKVVEKNLYLPKGKPEQIVVPQHNYFSIKGKGNPNDAFFAEFIGVLYSLSYAVKMSPKQGNAPAGYFEYSVYPLEGVWDINEAAKVNFNGTINKNDLVFNLMIRQPDFVTSQFAFEIIEKIKKKKPHVLLSEVRFETFDEGKCIQMMHMGSYDNEPECFRIMNGFAIENGLKRKNQIHREIYISDARKTAPEKLKTVLRFQVEYAAD
jgi:hypothetical protein